MALFDVVKRIRAYEAQSALPSGETIRTVIGRPEDALLVVFIRMGGVSTPWAVAWGHPNGAMNCCSTPDPRIARLARQPVSQFATALLQHLSHPNFKVRNDTYDPSSEAESRVRQIWIPNASHLEMFHQLAYRYNNTKEGDEHEVATLNAFSRAANFLFLESQRPGQTVVQKATTALKDAFTVPADDIRQGHLGFLLAWLDKKIPNAKKAEVSAHAEQFSISVTLDPPVERHELLKLVQGFGEALDGEPPNPQQAEAFHKEIHTILRRECQRRFDLLSAAWFVLRDDDRPQNPGLIQLIQKSNKELTWEYLRAEDRLRTGQTAFVASPETDYMAAAAAKRFLNHNYSEALAFAALAPHDRELLAEAYASGDAIKGSIVAIRNDGSGRTLEPFWEVFCKGRGALRLRVGSSVFLSENRKLTPTILSIDESTDESGVEGLKFTLYFDSQKRLALHPSWLNKEVVFLSDPGEGFLERKMMMIWDKSGPGAWLTHGLGKRVADE